ncbi:MAG TPA: hypothetical protein VII30_02625 [Gemmatimonadaceae bacterium]
MDLGAFNRGEVFGLLEANRRLVDGDDSVAAVSQEHGIATFVFGETKDVASAANDRKVLQEEAVRLGAKIMIVRRVTLIPGIHFRLRVHPEFSAQKRMLTKID